jgi:hypothetical protein
MLIPVLVNMEHAVTKWISGRQTVLEQLTHLTFVPSMVNTDAVELIVVMVQIVTEVFATKTDAISTLTVWVTQLSTALD